MQFENDGILLWYGTSDAPAPNGTVIEGSEIPITMGVQPPDASNVVEISYRINEGSTETIVAKFLRNEPFDRIQYFRAYLSSLKAGDRVEYNVICQCAGRQVPARTDEEQLPNSFQVVAATREEISTPTPEFVNTQQFQGGDRSQSEKVLTNTNTDIQDTPVFSTISEPVSNGLVAERIESTRSEPVSKGLAVARIESTKVLPIKISDERLDSFYSQNPDFDILQFNLLNGQTNNLNWENVERETTLNLLKKYQRLLRINPNPEIAKKLLNGTSQAESPIQSDSPTTSSAQQQEQPPASSSPQPAIDSAHAIASMTEEQFVRMMPGDEATARQMHKKAIDIKAKTQLLWANMKDAIASPHYRSMRVSTTQESDRAALARDIPSYQEMFGDLDYIDCEHCGSIFSPAAYFVDLMRIVDQYITEPNKETIREGQTLGVRRPDLVEDIELTCENTNTLVPSLQIINRILEARVKTALGSSDGLQSLATVTYPFNLPFNFPLEQIRSYLGHLKTDLATIYESFGIDELAIAREIIGLSWEEYNLITNSETNEEELKKIYGIENLDSLSNIEILLKQTGLSRTELTELIEQNLHKTELDKGLAHNFYINKILPDNLRVQIRTEESKNPTIENLIPNSLERINRFIRLAKKLNWSFADLDWVLTSIEASEIDEAAIKKIAKIKNLQAKYKLPIDVLCSFWHDMKTIGIGTNPEKPEVLPEKPQSLFERIFNNPFKEILGNGFYRLPDVNKQIDLNSFDREDTETNESVARICAALRLSINELTDIIKVIWEGETTINLNLPNLSQLFRISLILRLLGLNIKEYQILLSFWEINEFFLDIEGFIQITELTEWIKKSQFEIDELNYIINGNLSPNLDIGYSESDITEGIKSLWQLAIDSLLKPSDFIREGIEREKALTIFNKLLNDNYIENVTEKYKNVSQSSFDEEVALVKANINNDNFEINGINNISDEQKQYLQEAIKKAYDRQNEELKEIASFVAIEPDLAVSLLNFASIAQQNLDYVRLLLTPVSQTEQESDWNKIIEFFDIISRILLLTKKLEITPRELQSIANNLEAFGINELSDNLEFKLTINNLKTIDRFKKLIQAFGDDKDKLVEYFVSGSENSQDQKITELAELTGWKSEQISILVPSANQGNNRFNLDRNLHTTVEGIEKLKHCFDLSKHLGVNISWFGKLKDIATVNKEIATNWALYQNAARAVKEIAKAKYDDEEWTKISEKLEGELNERKRDVLTSWILWKNKDENLRDLSQDLLIDVETSSCASVSIIKEATLAIQTYLHRCRMGLEPGVKLDIPEIWWQWMMNYRVWEANRKVFLYPENYLAPSLRKIKSPIYKELEEELLQSEITQESVEKAYQNYFEKFAEIATLKPAGGYRCQVKNDTGEQDTLYLFGRTASQPFTYYYRECINPEAKKPTWNPWQKIDLVINSEQINAVYAFNKLFLFWIEIVTIDNKEKPENPVKKKTNATIKYSFQKFGKQWIQSQTLTQDITIENYNETNSSLWHKVTALPLSNNNDSEPDRILILFGNLDDKGSYYETQNKIQGTLLNIDLLQENRNIRLNKNTYFQNLGNEIYKGGLIAFTTDNLLYNNYVDDSRDGLNGRVSYFPMNEGKGKDIQDYVDDKNGTLQGDAEWKIVNDFPGAKSRRVIEFDGEDDYISFNNSNSPLGNKSYTIAAWIKPFEMGNDKGIVGWGNYDTQNEVNALRLSDNGIYNYWSTNDLPANVGSLTDGSWHHVAATFDGTTQKIFLDGEEKSSRGTFGPNVTRNDNFTIGRTHSQQYFKGQIAEVEIWNVALTPKSLRSLIKNISSSQAYTQAIKNQPEWFTFDNGDEAFLVIPEKPPLEFIMISNAHPSGINHIKFSRDNSLLASFSSSDKEIKIWEVETGNNLNTIYNPHPSQYMSRIEFSRDSSVLLSYSLNDNEIKIWEVGTGNNLNTISNVHRVRDGFPDIKFSPDSSLLASFSSSDQQIKIWELPTGNELNTISNAHPSGISDIEFSRDSLLLASYSYSD
ncbi:MAG: neuraminidase-like domain-containing protein, partial [Prochloraceae cyanobacterium]|nr:neuraminidase-like domain-containing protein [Prochloraceae cyanobacterium]